ncbi:NB-ARC domain-containing protein [Sphaerospermopsis torques-reginae]|uniref:NACHT domain-containing protein n=1 Tax=Sphaerospermopsis torques-reginae ITEP-024 TaxID=984208 RepID=A0ABX8WY11_9CYAN|nr:NB-ARC domain-containing protein [Sphaerospermopsis torques-reginae]QYX31337.1 NACHT domain-containing protein [Sphaerospermopsis torques-reginae ITEP-024]
MPRSLKVHHDYIDQVKIAITRNGYPNQRSLAHETGFSPTTVNSFITGKAVDYTTFEELCRRLNLDWREIAITNEDVHSTQALSVEIVKKTTNISSQNWGTAVDISAFYGRREELTQLESWIIQDSCRLVAVVGMGGVGKTTFVTHLAQQIQNHFDYVFWRSVPTITSFDDMITDMLCLISHHKQSKPDINRLIHYLRTHRCLIILDNLDIALETENNEYNNFLSIIAETNHKSCVIFTSLEKPIEVAFLEQWILSVRSLTLLGSSEVAFSLLQSKQLLGTDEIKYKLCQLYSNNPLQIKIVANMIIDLFNGDIEKFLQQNTLLVSNYINSLLRQRPK